MNNSNELKNNDEKEFVYETVTSINGVKVRRIKSSLFYLFSAISFFLGVGSLIAEKQFGVFLLFTLFPIFLIYPLIRFIFGGKDSVVGVVATVVVSEVLKNKLTSKKERTYKRRRR